MKRILTAAALAAALLSSAPRAAAACPYKVGPLGRYIAPAIVQGMTATNENQVEVWCSDALDGDDWFFIVDNETELRINDRVNLLIDAHETPDDFTDDTVEDCFSATIATKPKIERGVQNALSDRLHETGFSPHHMGQQRRPGAPTG